MASGLDHSVGQNCLSLISILAALCLIHLSLSTANGAVSPIYPHPPLVRFDCYHLMYFALFSISFITFKYS